MPNPRQHFPHFSFHGDESLLETPRRALLISRTARNPSPSTAWVQGIRTALTSIKRKNETLVTGLGRAPYEVALFQAKKLGVPAVIVLAEPYSNAGFTEDINSILPVRHLLIAPREIEKVDANVLRDQRVGEFSDRAFAIHVRANGTMARLAERLRGLGLEVIEVVSSDNDVDLKPIVPTNHWADAWRSDSWEYLTHYTRTPEGLWPGEKLSTYFEWLLNGPQTEHRDAAATLQRILTEKKIRGSGLRLPGNLAMVSFTALSPWRFSEWQQYRRGLQHWNVEPFGIAIRRDVLEKLGARPVQYFSKMELKRVNPETRSYAQNDEWKQEEEWRLEGDVRLDALPADSFKIVRPA